MQVLAPRYMAARRNYSRPTMVPASDRRLGSPMPLAAGFLHSPSFPAQPAQLRHRDELA